MRDTTESTVLPLHGTRLWSCLLLALRRCWV